MGNVCYTHVDLRMLNTDADGKSFKKIKSGPECNGKKHGGNKEKRAKKK